MDTKDELILEMLKALSNAQRLQILGWLANPEESFADLEEHVCGGIPGWGGACVGTVQEKSGLSQSTVSGYLKSMQRVGLLESRRHERWTYYRVNVAAVERLRDYFGNWCQLL